MDDWEELTPRERRMRETEAMSKDEEAKWKNYYERLDFHRMRKLNFKPRLSPVQVLALAVLRDSGDDEALMAALVDEIMGTRGVLDELVTEDWCRVNGWETTEEEPNCWYSPGEERRWSWAWVMLKSKTVPSRFGVQSDRKSRDPQTHAIVEERIPTTRELIRLCNALSIPWTTKRS